MNKEIKVVFFGSADFSVPILLELIKRFKVQAVVTEIDKPAGRGREIIQGPVKIMAKQHKIPYFQPLSIKKNPKLYKMIADLKPDVIVTASYGKIIPLEILNIPEHGSINVHPSLLPKYRGCSPIQTALCNGDDKTGVTIILMDEGMDSGDIIDQKEIEINPNEDYTDLAHKLALLSAEMLVTCIPKYINGQIELVIQDDHQATFTKKIEKNYGRIDWQKTAKEIFNQYRGYKLWPGSFTTFKNRKLDLIEIEYNNSLKIDDQYKNGQVFVQDRSVYIKCSDGAVQIKQVKLEGKKEVDINNFVNGHQDFVGSILI